MRLTLRTLLAWLDDTLSPSEVREIGKQVGDSQIAKELVDRIHRVTRQRRLTVPPRTGIDAIDPNLVSSYLDNELDPDAVAELEKKCLTSDVHLAEVASVHQILSLIGQKAKVPTEARHRMYGLIKGRESVKPRAPRASKQTEPTPVSEPVQPWVSPPQPARPFLERFGPLAGVVALIAILCATAWSTLTPPEVSPKTTLPIGANDPGAPPPAAIKKAAAPEAVAVVEEPKPDAKAKGAEPKAKGEGGDTVAVVVPPKGTEQEKAAAAEKAKAKDEKVAVEIPPGAAGLAKKPTGVLLRFNPKQREWDRLTDAAALREQDRLLCLQPFRATVEIGTAEVDLVNETEIWASSTPATLAARFNLAQGRVVLHGTAPSLPFEVQLGGKTVTITPPPGAVVGVERINRRAMGEPKAGPPALQVFANDGPVTVSTAGHEATTLDSAGSVTVESDGTIKENPVKGAPEWVTQAEPTPFEQEVGELFLKSFRSDRSVVACLVEASEDEQKDVCRLAIWALRAVGDISMITPFLNSKGDKTASTKRKTAITVLRSFLAQSPEMTKTLREQLVRDQGDEQAVTTEQLLIGYTPKEANNPETYAKLVEILGTKGDADVGLRELALDNLKHLTGRDDLEYDPEAPEGKGLTAWRDLQKGGELRPAGVKKPAN